MPPRRERAWPAAHSDHDIEARLAPFFLFPLPDLLMDEPVDPAPKPAAPTTRRRVTQLRHEPV